MQRAQAQVALSHDDIRQRLDRDPRDRAAWNALTSSLVVPLVRRALAANSRRSAWLEDELVARVSLKLLKRLDRAGVADIRSLPAFVATVAVRERNQHFRLEERSRRAASAERLERLVDQLATDPDDRVAAQTLLACLAPALEEVITRGGKPADIARAVKQLNAEAEAPVVYPHWREVCQVVYGPANRWPPGREATYREQWRRFHERFVHAVRRRMGEE